MDGSKNKSCVSCQYVRRGIEKAILDPTWKPFVEDKQFEELPIKVCVSESMYHSLLL